MKRNILTLVMSLVMTMFVSVAFGQTNCSKKSKADCEMKKKESKDATASDESTVSLSSSSTNAAKAADQTADCPITECRKKCAKESGEAITKKQKAKSKDGAALVARKI